MLPPGQAATSSMPRPMLGAGRIASTSRKLKAGSSTNWASMPISTALGARPMRLKSAGRRSSATPNITSPMMTLSAHSDCGLKFSRTRSISLIASLPLRRFGRADQCEIQPLGSSCIFLKWISPGAHMCLTGSTST